MLLKLLPIISILAVQALAKEIALCEYPQVENLVCLRIGKKLDPDKYEVNKCDANTVENKQALFFCKGKTNITSHSSVYRCVSGEWKSTDERDVGLPQCRKTCPELLHNMRATHVRDSYENILKADERLPAGTVISVSCKGNYRQSLRFKKSLECLDSGDWNATLADCILSETGIRKLVKINLLSANGNKTNIETYPYHVGIYSQTKHETTKTFVCGGSIIAPQIIVTAAHCFKMNRNGNINAKNYFVAAGKTYREYEDSRDSQTAQFRDAAKVYFHTTYQGADTKYADDLAIIALQDPLQYNDHVQPVDVLKEDAEQDNSNFPSGEVVGWGTTLDQQLSDQLQAVVLDEVQCPAGIVAGKFCAYGTQNAQATCQGDSGGGYVITIDKQKFLIGVVSTAAKAQNQVSLCESEPTAFTSITSHYDLITQARSYLEAHFTCPDHVFSCTSIDCIPMEQVCDGVSQCTQGEDERHESCSVRSSFAMWTKGLEILKYFSKCDFYPNWVVPTSAMWLAAKYLAETTPKGVSEQTRRDFGIHNQADSVIAAVKAASIVDSKLRHTVPLADQRWVKKLFHEDLGERQMASDFFYQNNSRATIIYDSDLTLGVDGWTTKIAFKNLDSSVSTVDGICVPNGRYQKMPKLNSYMYRVQINSSLALYMIEPEQDFDQYVVRLRSFRLDTLGAKVNNNATLCFPLFKVQTSADYSPIFYRLGYDFLFNLDPIETNIASAPLRLKTFLRGFISIIPGNEAPPIGDVRQEVKKPFVFVLEDTTTNSIIFIGQVRKGGVVTRYADSFIKCKPFTVA